MLRNIYKQKYTLLGPLAKKLNIKKIIENQRILKQSDRKCGRHKGMYNV